jgi:hypothetical protein
MAYDGSGNYSLPANSLVTDGTVIDAADHNVPITDIAASLSQVLLRSGVAPMTGNLNMGGYTITNVTGFPLPGGTNTWTGSNTWTGTNVMSTTGTTPLQLLSTNPDANSGPVLDLYRNSSSPANSDLIGGLYFNAKNSGNVKTAYAAIIASASDVFDGTEDGKINFWLTSGGSSLGTKVVMDSTRMYYAAGYAVDNTSTRSSFSAHKNNVDQNATGGGTIDPVTFGTAQFNVGAHYSTSTSKWTPPAGTAMITATVAAAIPAGGAFLHIYKDGVSFKSLSILQETAASGATSSTLVIVDQCDGSNVYDVRFSISSAPSGSMKMFGATTRTFFMGTMV